MKTCCSALTVVAALARIAAGHATFQQASKGDVDYGNTCVRMPVSLSLVDKW